MSLSKSRGNLERMIFNCWFWSCVRLVEVAAVKVLLMKFWTVIGSVFCSCTRYKLLMKFWTVIGSVDGFVLR